MCACMLTRGTGSCAARNERTNTEVNSQACLWKSCSLGRVAARGVSQVIQLYVQKADNSKLNNMSLVTTQQRWLRVDSHHTANSPATVTPTLLSSSPVASVLASLTRLGCVECRVVFDTYSVSTRAYFGTFIYPWWFDLAGWMLSKMCSLPILKDIYKYGNSQIQTQLSAEVTNLLYRWHITLSTFFLNICLLE